MTTMRCCRVCLQPEEGLEFSRILDENKKFALDLFYVSQIKVVEFSAHFPALICPRCEVNLSSAVNFKKISILGDTYHRKQIKNLECELFELEPEIKSDPYLEDPQIVEEEFLTAPDDYEVVEEHLDDFIEYDYAIEEQEEQKVVIVESVLESQSPTKKYSKQNFQCEICNKNFTTKNRYENHFKMKHIEMTEEEMLQCLTCGKRFKTQTHLEIHIRNIHTDNPMRHRQHVACSICGQILKSIVALKNHEECHTISSMPEDVYKKFICDICGKRFRLKGYLFNHLQNAHLRTKHVCEFCNKGYYKRYELQEHIIVHHTDERPFVCEHEGCGKTFKRQKNLNIHNRIHTGERPYACDYCPKTYVHFIDKKRHMMNHTGDRPYKCDKCSKTFIRGGDLKSHMKTHSN